MKKSLSVMFLAILFYSLHANPPEVSNNSRYENITDQCKALLKNLDDQEISSNPHNKLIISKMRDHAIIIMALLSVIDVKSQFADDVAVTARQKKILAILEQGPMSRVEIKEKLDIQLHDRVMQKDLARLRELGLVQSSGKTKSMIWRKVK